MNNHFDGLVDRFTCDTNNPIALLASLWEFGFYPPPEIMSSIANTYNHYLTLGGVATLEEVFFGKPPKPTGTHSKQEAKKSAIQMLDFFITCDKINSSNISNLDRACEVVDMWKLKTDPESLLRKYRRYKKDR